MNVKNLVLGIGIVIVFALALWQGIEAFYPSPQYDDFCITRAGLYPEKIYAPQETNCTFSRQLQEQVDECYANQGQPVYEYNDNGCTTALKTCDYCSKDFEEAEKSYSKIIFIISLIVGIITLLIGYMFLNVEPVGSALIGSGIWSIFYGSAWNWRNFSNIWRFLLLLLALIILIWITIKLNLNREKPFKIWKK